MNDVTLGLYRSPADAAEAVRLLEKRGVPMSSISVIARDNLEKDGIVEEKHSKAPEGFTVGAVGGGALGALFAGFTAVGSIATGGAGLGLLVAGPIWATLVGAGAGATAGSIVGGMVGAAMPERAVRYYEGAIDAGSVLISVKTTDDDATALVRDILREAGAERISKPDELRPEFVMES